MAIGLKVLGMDPTGKTTADMLKSVDELTKTPELKLRARILAGELKGGDEARQRLSALKAPDAPPDVLKMPNRSSDLCKEARADRHIRARALVRAIPVFLARRTFVRLRPTSSRAIA